MGLKEDLGLDPLNEHGYYDFDNDPEPLCGVDFCEMCGDCLHCYGGDPCHRSEDDKHEHQDSERLRIVRAKKKKEAGGT